MSSSLQSQVFDLNDVSLQQVFAELETTEVFNVSWLNQDLQSVAAMGELSTVKFEFSESPSNSTKAVIFGDINWQNWFLFQQSLAAKGLTVVGNRLKKPTAELDGAVEILLAEQISVELKNELMGTAENFNLEFCYIEKAPEVTKPGLIVMDMDSTAIQIECIDEIAKLAGVGEEVSKVTAAAMRGELDFAQSLRARVKTLTGAPVSVIDEVADNLPLMPGLESLCAELQKHGWKIVIASGGFTYMTEVLKEKLNLDKTVANQLDMKDGFLTGEVSGRIVDANVKAETVEELAKEWGIDMSQTIAMGDGANDLVMMAASALGVAFHAKPVVRQKADVSVRTGGLDQLLYLI